jgi:RNA recognition motif-containing protein
MAKKIYVGNLSYQITEADLSDLFAQVGSVESVQIITDRDTGRSKGFAFVEMNDDEAAGKAITRFNGQEVSGRAMIVNEARPMQKREFRTRGAGGGGGHGGGRGSRDGYSRY